MTVNTATTTVPVYRLERVGAGRQVAVFVCSHLLGEEVEVVDVADYNRIWDALRVVARQCPACFGRGGSVGAQTLSAILCRRCEPIYHALGIPQPFLTAPEVGHE